jgi:arylsulfatase A
MSDITRRGFLNAMGLGAASLMLPRDLLAGEPGSQHPNIIGMMADDVSAREFGCYGHRTHRTPVLDGLAKIGVQFQTAWATPICSPTRAEIMTGRCGFRTGREPRREERFRLKKIWPSGRP